MKIFWTYHRFLLKNIIKYKFAWISTILYLFTISLFLFIIPYFSSTNPLQIWSTPILNIQLMICYIASIYSAMFVFPIYKNSEDVDLLISSKPITKNKFIFCKFVTLIFVVIIVSLITSLLGFVSFLFNQLSTYECWSIILMLFFLTFIILSFYSFISTIAALFLNKVWTLISPMIFTVIFTIYWCIVSYSTIFKTPIDFYFEQHKTSQITTTTYLDTNNQFHHYAYLLDANINQEQLIFNLSTPGGVENIFNDIKTDWEQYNKPGWEIPNYLNFNTHIQQLSHVLALDDFAHEVSASGFGSDKNCKYTIKNSFIANRYQTVQAKDLPLMYPNYNSIPYISEEDAANQQTYTLYFLTNLQNQSFLNSNFYTLGSQSNQISSDNIDSLLGNKSVKAIAQLYESKDALIKYLELKEFKLNDNEKKFFDLLLNSQDQIIFSRYDDNSQYQYKLPMGLLASQNSSKINIKPFSNNDSQTFNYFINFGSEAFKLTNISNPQSTIQFTKTDGFPLYQYIHFCLLNKIKNSQTNKYLSLDINDNSKLAIESLKFKLYLATKVYQNLTFNSDTQEKIFDYFNKILNSFATNIDQYTIANPLISHPLILPLVKINNIVEPNKLFYDSSAIAFYSLLFNFSLNNDKYGFDTKNTYEYQGKNYLDPLDFHSKKYLSNVANLLSGSSQTFFSSFLGFEYDTQNIINTNILIISYLVIDLILSISVLIILKRFDIK